MISDNLSATKNKLQQVFLYITGRCNASCTICYISGHHYDNEDMSLSTATNYLKKYRELGVSKVTFLGGEPTLHPKLGQIIAEAKNNGYIYLRLTTNGKFDPDILHDKNFQNLDTIAFSIDGHTNEINGHIRHGIDLEQVLYNMQIARKLGYNIRVNTTITKMNVDFIEDIINLSVKNGATQINLNMVFLKGRAANNPELLVKPEKWLQVYNNISASYFKYPIEIKLPLCYMKNTKQYKRNHECLAIEGTRLYVMPDGEAYPCLLSINDPFPVMPQNISINIRDDKDLHFFCPLPIIGEYLSLCIYSKCRLNQSHNKI